MNHPQTLVNRIYQAFISGNLQGIVDLCSPEVTWCYYGLPTLPIMGDFQGKTGVQTFFNLLRELTQPLAYEWREIIANEDSAVVLGLATVQVRATGKTFEHQWCHIYNFQADQIIAFRGFTSNPQGMVDAFKSDQFPNS
jgi:ketosteroid isomerase-like protein